MIRPLTGVRFIAAMWVVLYHFRRYLSNAGWLPEALNDVLSFGAVGVSLFWVLSGFVLTVNYLDRLGHRPSISGSVRFWWLRLARVWPVHVVTMLLSGWAAGYVNEPLLEAATTPFGVARNLFLVNNWPMWATNTSWNQVSWTVSFEWMAYLAFPVLALALLRIHRWFPTWLLVMFAAVPIPSFALWCALHHPVERPAWVFAVELGVDFFTGSVLCLIYLRVKNRQILTRRAMRLSLSFVPPLLIIAACLVVPQLIDAANVPVGVEVPYYARSFITPLFIVWVLALALQHGGRHSFMGSRAVVFGGSISYSLYMVQFVWNQVWRLWFGNAPTDGWDARAYVVGFLVGMLAASFLMWRLIEEPARHLMQWTVLRSGRNNNDDAGSTVPTRARVGAVRGCPTTTAAAAVQGTDRTRPSSTGGVAAPAAAA